MHQRKNLFLNIDNIRHGSSGLEYDPEHAVEKVKHESGKDLHVSYHKHFMDRLNHVDETTGEPSQHKTGHAGPRRVDKRGMPLPWSSVKIHTKKILDNIANSNGEHIPSAREKKTTVSYEHKPTGHKILVHLHYTGEKTPPRVDFRTYLGHDFKTDSMDRKSPLYRRNKDGSHSYTKILESVIMRMLIECMEKPYHVTLD